MENLFLSIDGVEIEDVEEGGYTAYEQELGVTDRMISGRLVEELRATVWVVEVAYSEIDSETLKRLQDAMKSTRKHLLFFLPPDGSTSLQSGYFHLTAQPSPSLARWNIGNSPTWSGFTLHFEEVTGHD